MIEVSTLGFARYPVALDAPEITRFLNFLAVDRSVAASTQNQALSALLFLYREVLDQDLPWLDDLVRAQRPARLPVVLTRDEVRASGQHINSYELDMPAPSGMSGAPLVLRGGLEVAGVLFGTQDVELVDAESGPGKRYQTTRVVSLGLAHTANALRRASARATEGIPLADFLAE